MSQTLPVKSFKWVKKKSKFIEDFIKHYDKDSNTGYILEVDIDYPKELFNIYKDLPFLPERNICSIEDKKKYVIHITALKQALNHGLILRKVHRITQFKQKDWLKSYIDMNTELRKKAKNEFETNLFKRMNNFFFWKNNVKYEKSQGYQTSNIRKKEKTENFQTI